VELSADPADGGGTPASAAEGEHLFAEMMRAFLRGVDAPP
jgi:hypothetical protein